MAKSLRTYLADIERLLPGDFVRIDRQVDPSNFDCSAIVKQLGLMKKFPLVLFERPLNVNGTASDIRLLLNAEISQRKMQVALGLPFGTTRVEMVEWCGRRDAESVPPTVIPRDQAPVKEHVRSGDGIDFLALPIMKHHHGDSGPYLLMVSVLRDRDSGHYEASYHRMEIKGSRLAAWVATPRASWEVFRAYEAHDEACPVVTVLGHHPAFHMGAAYRVLSESGSYERVGAYLKEPLRVTPSETWGETFMAPADAEVVIEGVLHPHERLSDGPFGESSGYLGPKRHDKVLHYEPRAISYRDGAIAQSIITPEGEKPWLELPGEAAHLRRAREAVPGVTAVCRSGRHAYFSVFVSMKKVSEGDPGRVAAALLSFEHAKHVFVFDDDIDVYDPADILWALATRVQPHKQVQVIKDFMKGAWLDPSCRDLGANGLTSCMIVDATRPLGRPFSPISRRLDEALERVKLEAFIPQDRLEKIPIDRTSYWG